MATTRRQPGEPETVNPMVEDGPTEGVSTMEGLFNQKATVVDEVQEIPYQQPGPNTWWVIRPNRDIEDMTVGLPEAHFSFKEGIRYKVPVRIAEILFNRDALLEVPYPYDS
jgi:hypothetical protein